MKLSDAIATGRVLLRPVSNFLADGEGGGCALGMGLTAIGVTIEHPQELDEPFKAWPWLENQISLPCGCYGKDNGGLVIAHLFDDHVMRQTADDKWTLDRLIDWIASVEPANLPKPAPAPPAEQQIEEALETVPGPISNLREE